MGRGYLEIARWGGAPIRLHWTLPLGALLFSQGRLSLGAIVGFVLIVLIHEIGHALVVKRQRLEVVAIDVHGLGGVCRWSGNATPLGRARVAWGGVNAQLVAFGVTALALAVLGQPTERFTAELAGTFTTTNLWIVALNLIPVPPFDGAEAWKLPGLLRERARSRRAKERSAQAAAAQQTLRALDARDREVPEETAAAVDARLRELASGPRRKGG